MHVFPPVNFIKSAAGFIGAVAWAHSSEKHMPVPLGSQLAVTLSHATPRRDSDLPVEIKV